MTDDLPIIRCNPGPSDAELQAERDAKHAADLAAFDQEERYLQHSEAFDTFRGFDHIPPRAVRG